MEIISPAEDVATPIQKFYENQNIFITGGTGFLGKAIIEKLLRECSSLNTIYLLIRSKKGKSLHERVDDILNDVLFETVKKQNPKYRHKIQGISGDCALPDLGLNQQDKDLLLNEISLVFHIAATVKFDEKLHLATAINIQCPATLFEMCKNIKNLKSVIHVSTAYSNCIYSYIDEKFYPTPIDAKKLINITNTTDEKTLDNITHKIIGDWPNTYTFTKAVAEDYIRTECAELPIGVFRPAIVVSTYKEPIKAWIDNMYGPTGVVTAAATGLLRSIHCDGSINSNLVPVDFCINGLICSAWQVHKEHQKILKEKRKKTELDIPIYNYESNTDNPLSWQELMDRSVIYGINNPSSKSIWYYSFALRKSYFMHILITILFQLIPALIADSVLFCFGKPAQIYKMSRKIMKFTFIINYFTSKLWTYSNKNVKKLHQELTPEDREKFQFDMRQLDWHIFCKNYCLGVRTYLLKEPLSTIPEARRRYRKLYWLHQFTKFVLFALFLRFCWFLLSLFT